MKRLLALSLFGLLSTGAFAADNAIVLTPGSGVTERSIDIGLGVQAPGIIPVSSTGTAIYGTAGTANANILTVQGIASMTPFLTTTTLNAETTKVIGTVRNLGNAGGVFDGATAAAVPANALYIGINSGGNLVGWNGAITAASGAFASGSIASGAVASGALAAGSISSGAAVSGAFADGAIATVGAQADSVCGTATGTCTLQALIKFLNTAATSATPAGTNTIGNVGSDPSSGKGTPSSVAINVSSNTTTQLVALSGSTKIYVTSFDVIAGGTGNITFEYGTGASCGTGTTALTGAYNLTAQAGISKGNGLGAILVVPAGNALCVLTSAAVQMSGSVSFQQF